MSFAKAHDLTIQNSAFTDVQGDINYFIHSAEAGIAELRDAISSGASHDSLERYPPPQCHAKTRKAVLERISQWIRASDQESSILWLHGPAGAGKSAIAQTVAEGCSEGKELVATFFFSRGKPGRDTAAKLWATLAFQMSLCIPPLREGVGMAMIDNPSIFHKSLDVQLQKLLIEPLRSLDIPPRSPFLVVVDGLDECKGDSDQCHILSSISTIINTHNLPFRFLIASRPEPHIRRAFDSPSLRQICSRITLDDSFQPVNDVYIYLRSEFDTMYEKHRNRMVSVKKPWPSDPVVWNLARRSSGQFIYASTVLKFIDDEDCRPTDQLKIVLDASRSTAFTELDQLYQQILSTCIYIPLLLRILGCILVAKLPLFAIQIEELLSFREGDVGLTLRRLHSLVRDPDSGDSIIPYHASLEDFIFNETRSGDFHLSRTEAHLEMSHGCLSLARQCIFSQYVSMYWAFHCSNAEPKDTLVSELVTLDYSSWQLLLHTGGNLHEQANITIPWLKEHIHPLQELVIQLVTFLRHSEILVTRPHATIVFAFGPYCSMFERLNISLAAMFLNIKDNELLVEHLNWENDGQAFFDLIKNGARRSSWYCNFDIGHAHRHLASRCITILLNLPVSKYWAKHLALVPFTNFNLLERFVSDYDGLGERMTWKQTLEDLGHCYFTLPLDGADAHLVVKWLRTCPGVPTDLISLWQCIAGHSRMQDCEYTLPVPWTEKAPTKQRALWTGGRRPRSAPPGGASTITA